MTDIKEIEEYIRQMLHGFYSFTTKDGQVLKVDSVSAELGATAYRITIFFKDNDEYVGRAIMQKYLVHLLPMLELFHIEKLGEGVVTDISTYGIGYGHQAPIKDRKDHEQEVNDFDKELKKYIG